MVEVVEAVGHSVGCFTAGQRNLTQSVLVPLHNSVK